MATCKKTFLVMVILPHTDPMQGAWTLPSDLASLNRSWENKTVPDLWPLINVKSWLMQHTKYWIFSLSRFVLEVAPVIWEPWTISAHHFLGGSSAQAEVTPHTAPGQAPDRSAASSLLPGGVTSNVQGCNKSFPRLRLPLPAHLWHGR